jgi:sulfonate transport system ATP-binding protein
MTSSVLTFPFVAAQDASASPRRRSHGLELRLQGVHRRFEHREVLQQIDLHVRPGEFVAIVGRSGCGKSTLLRLLAGLDAPSAGRITRDSDARAAGPRDDTRLMFQDARLLPWKRVVDNVALGLRGDAPRRRARDALEAVGLADRADDWPSVLSGGQRQRVALARALVHQPRLLLLDEPLGALDALTRIEMQQLIERLWLAQGFSAVLVTHDVSEAVALADRVLLVERGRIALDQPITLERPRRHGTPGFAALEARLLDRLLREPATAAHEPVVTSPAPARDPLSHGGGAALLPWRLAV